MSNKSVLISIRPEWCEKIAIGEKTIEVRKTRPKLETPFKCCIYCTRGEYLCLTQSGNVMADKEYNRILDDLPVLLNGKVFGEFVCDRIEHFDVPYPAYQKKLDKRILEQSCLTYYQLHRYAYHDDLYGWHISELKIYDTPKELSEFRGMCKYMDRDCFVCPYYDYSIMDCKARKTKRPPRSWCYVEGL